MGRQLEDYTAEELRALPYAQILELRRDAFTRHVAAMAVPPVLRQWADRMAARFGDRVHVWRNVVPWLEALLIVRYGEDVTQWPPAFSDADVHRAAAWYTGRRTQGQRGTKPLGVQYYDDALFHDAGVVTDGSLLAVLASLMALPGKWATAALVALGLSGLLSALTNFWENELIDHLFRARSYTAPTDHFIALFTAAPGETGGGTEVSGGSYARVQVAAGFANFEGTNGETTNVDSAGAGGATQNRNAITFPTPSANWGTITHFASLSASSSGDMYFYGALAASKNVNNGDPAPSFAAGALDFALA